MEGLSIESIPGMGSGWGFIARVCSHSNLHNYLGVGMLLKGVVDRVFPGSGTSL